MLQFLLHFVFLLVQLLDGHFSGSDFSLQLFDLVIEHELELFQFLSLLLEVLNSLLLLSDSAISLPKLSLLRLDALSQVVRNVYLLLQFVFCVLYFLLLLLNLLLALFVVVGDNSEISLAFHALVDYLSKGFFVGFSHLIDFNPGFVVDSFSLLFVFLHHLLDLLT